MSVDAILCNIAVKILQPYIAIFLY